jgi:DNA-binding CsgD family transcriptional regulator
MNPKLSTRELQVLRLAGAGYTSRKIARILQCSYYTVETHKKRAFRKIGASSIGHALVLAHQKGLLNICEIDAPIVPNFPD